jgi:hypothetical protein
MQQPDETPGQPEARHSETYPERAAAPGPQGRGREAFSAGECGDAIWECEAADGEMREDAGFDPHAARPRQSEAESGGQGWRIIDLVERRERRE